MEVVKQIVTIIFCFTCIVATLTSCSQLGSVSANELDTEIIGLQKQATDKAIFKVRVRKTAMTDDNTYYKIGICIGDTTYMNEGTKFMKSALDIDRTVPVTVQDNHITEMLKELDRIHADKRESAQREYEKFAYEHSAELLAGAFGLGPQAGLSYEQYQKLLEEEERLKAAISNPPDIDYDSFCRKYVQVVIIKEPVPSAPPDE